MKTPICPTCGCSLVRLGISNDLAPTYSHDGKESWRIPENDQVIPGMGEERS